MENTRLVIKGLLAIIVITLVGALIVQLTQGEVPAWLVTAAGSSAGLIIGLFHELPKGKE